MEKPSIKVDRENQGVIVSRRIKNAQNGVVFSRVKAVLLINISNFAIHSFYLLYTRSTKY